MESTLTGVLHFVFLSYPFYLDDYITLLIKPLPLIKYVTLAFGLYVPVVNSAYIIYMSALCT